MSIGKSFQAGCEFSIHLAVYCTKKQGPASCYSIVTNLSPGCGPIKAHDVLGICGVALSLEKGLELLDLRSLRTCCLLPVNQAHSKTALWEVQFGVLGSPGQPAFPVRASLHSNTQLSEKHPVTVSAFRPALWPRQLLLVRPNLPSQLLYHLGKRQLLLGKAIH